MIKPIILFFSLFLFPCIYAENNSKLLEKLDDAISNRQQYMSIKESRIDSLRQLLNPSLSFKEQYDINDKIYDEYLAYKYDSAMVYIEKNKVIAQKIENPKYSQKNEIKTAMLLSTGGLFGESLGKLNNIDRDKLDEPLLYNYYSVLESTYQSDAEYINDSKYTLLYNKYSDTYRDSILLILPKDSELYQSYLGKSFLGNNDLDNAEKVLLPLYKTLDVDTRLYAIVTYNLAKIYNRKGMSEEEEKFLILASISDQMCPLKENRAMQELAIFLYKNRKDKKSLNKAYEYIQLSMEDALFYNNRLRVVQISQKLPIILKAYQDKKAKETRNLKITILIISLLSIIMIGLLFYIYRQIKIIKLVRKNLTKTNNKLHLDNVTKEKHLGLFMDLASSYIDKLSASKEFVRRKLQANQIDDLVKFVNSSKAIDAELKDFFKKFDSSFLALFPTFVEDINKLFRDDQQIKLKKDDELNAELRIYALIRLGINDSAQIISFLRYSPQTVYNYRAKTKNRAKIDKDNFEKSIMDIGIS